MISRMIYQISGTVLSQSPCDDWEPYKDETCVKIFNNPGLLSYEDANSYCASQDFSLMSVDSEEKQHFIENFFKSKNVVDYVWLGLKYSEDNGYQWSDDTPFDFSNWAAGSPKNDSAYCVEVHTEEEDYGKWSEVLCSKKNLVLCEKLQPWPSSKVQKTLMNLVKNPVPKGFIYVQLPKEKLPSEIWPWLGWEDVTSEYAGVFFRAEGGNSSVFGEVQDENCPRLVNAMYNQRHGDGDLDGYVWNIDLKTDNKQSGAIRTGVYLAGNYNSETGLSFRVSSGEVRPRNMAVRIWKRVK